MNGLALHTTLTLDDWQALQRACIERVRALPGHRLSAVLVAAGVTGVVLTGLALTVWFGGASPWPFLAGAFAVLAAMWIGARGLRARYAPDDEGVVLGPMRIEFDVEGMRVEKARASSLTRWAAIRDITVTPQHVFVWVDRIAAQAVPVRDLPEGMTAESLASRLRHASGRDAASANVLWSDEGAPIGDSGVSDTVRMQVGWLDAPDMPGAAPPRPSGLRVIARLLSFRRVGREDIPTSDTALALLGAMPLLAWLLYDRWSAGSNAWWYGSGVGGLAWNLVATGILAWATGRVASPAQPLRTMLWIAGGLMLVVVPVQAGLLQWGTYPLMMWIQLGLTIWGLAVLGRALHGFGVKWVIAPLAVALLGVLGYQLVADRAFLSAGMWYPAEADDEAGGDGGDGFTDRWLLAQPERVDAALERLAPRDPTRSNIFFLGVAGYAEEKVFAEEIELAARVVGRRYGSTSRSIELVNDRRDVDARPAATVWTLERTLRGIAARMDAERDVLFLALSSHGSEDGEFTLSAGGLVLEQLTPGTLRKALDEAGIRWRVIVVSACFSGAFVPPLQDSRTIVITASAADRSSFGCSDQRDVTYFGEAFYRDALPRALSLEEAFETAQQTIKRREKAEDLEPSQPQGVFGSEIARFWADFVETNAYRVQL